MWRTGLVRITKTFVQELLINQALSAIAAKTDKGRFMILSYQGYKNHHSKTISILEMKRRAFRNRLSFQVLKRSNHHLINAAFRPAQTTWFDAPGCARSSGRGPSPQRVWAAAARSGLFEALHVPSYGARDQASTGGAIRVHESGDESPA
jgi:hypothetical protein